ncbi:MAG: hypothetical protein ABR924_19735 [Terracidiphilus sp.]|jgi:hypothetical protein
MSQNTDLALYYTRDQINQKLETLVVSPSTGSTTHAEPLTDGVGDFIFAGGDIVVVLGVPN